MTTPPVRLREDVLYDGEFTRVIRVSPPSGAGSMIRKESVGALALARLRHERAMLRRLAGVAGVPQLIEREPQADWILMEDAQARPISDVLIFGDIANDELVRIALALTRIIGAVHRRGVLHRDISPNNILLTPDGAPQLIDFHLSALLSDERLDTTRTTEIIGTLSYVAPEQTGRTGRRVDQRSDLYALGATLYEFATGRPPFGRGDPLRLVHDHLARLPAPPADINGRLPRSLSDVILRLLEKEPDGRYQSAEGLAHDLNLVREEMSAGRTSPVNLGTRDFPQRLRAPGALVGRVTEMAALTAQFAEARQGRARALFIAGDAGVGKGALVEQLRPIVTSAGGWMVGGRYEEFRQDSRSDATWQALRALGRQLLTEPEEQLAERRAAVRQALGSNVGLMAAVAPEFGVLLDEAPRTPRSADAVQLERRGHHAALDLIEAVVSAGRPLVIVLDDLQWASPSACALVGDMLTDQRLRGLLVVGTYRDNEIAEERSIHSAMRHWEAVLPPPRVIRLDNLSSDDLGAFLQKMLRLSRDAAADLADAIGAHSHGNPYNTVELVNALRHDGILLQQDGGWSWDKDNLWRHLDRGDVVSIIADRLSQLPDDSIELLEVMACVGATVELALLADACGEARAKVADLLATPAAENLVVIEEGDDATVHFQHDRVQQAVLSRLSEVRRKEISRRIARRLAPVAEFASVAAEQYIATIDEIADRQESREVVDLLRRAAHDVRTMNPATAENFLSTAIALLRNAWQAGDERLLLALRSEQHAVLQELGRYEEVDRIFAEIHGEDTDPMDLVAAVAVQMGSLCDRGLEQDGLALGFDQLRRLGLDPPRLPVAGAPMATQWTDLYEWANHLDLADDVSRPSGDDPHDQAVAQTLGGLIPSAYFSDTTALAWVIFEARRRWVDLGPSPELASALTLTPAILNKLRHDYRTGMPILRHLQAVSQARRWEPVAAFITSCLPLFASHWFEPLENTLLAGRRAREALMKGGYLQAASYSYAPTLAALLDAGPTLDALGEEIEPAIALAMTTGNSHTMDGYLSYRQLLRAMREQTTHPGAFTDDTFDAAAHIQRIDHRPIEATMFRINRSMSALIFGDLDVLIEQAGAALPQATGLGSYREALAHLFQALAMAHQMHAAAPRTELLSELDRCRDWLAERAADAPANFTHLVHLIDAERAWAIGETPAAAQAFDEALFGSGNRSRPWQRAFIAERAARFYHERELDYLSRTLMTEAWRRYEAWGANAKVAQLERQFPYLRGSSSTQRELGVDPTGTAKLTSDALDLIGLLQASQALSSERDLDRLRSRVVDTLGELTGATDVQVLLWDNETRDWIKPADPRHGASSTVDEAAARGVLPLAAFRYAERTREPLLVDDAVRDHRFSGDPYFKNMQRCSLMVVPVLAQSEPRAMLVLENNLTRGAFTTDRLDAANLIAGQLSVSLDNAMIYASLERKVSERTRELEIANQRLEVLAVTDALTGLANRRRLLDVLEVELLRSLRTGAGTGVMMIDIDFFKAYNDRYGHVAGDDCLRKVSDALQRGLRSTDVIARYGGEEFAVVLPHTGLAESKDIAERARASVAALREPHLGAPGGIVTVSIGIASQIATRQTTTEQVLAAADAQLYEAKGTGRNRIHGLPT